MKRVTPDIERSASGSGRVPGDIVELGAVGRAPAACLPSARRSRYPNRIGDAVGVIAGRYR